MSDTTSHILRRTLPGASSAVLMVLPILIVGVALAGCSGSAKIQPVPAPIDPTRPGYLTNSAAATSVIDALAAAIRAHNKDRALLFLAKKHGDPSGNLDTIIPDNAEFFSDWLLTRRLLGETPSYFYFEMKDARNGATSTLRVYRRRQDDGVYEDEGVAIP